MPGFDRTGPMGDGPMTGRRMGRCTGNGPRRSTDNAETPENFMDGMQGRYSGRRIGSGWPLGGRGRGNGLRNRFRGRY